MGNTGWLHQCPDALGAWAGADAPALCPQEQYRPDAEALRQQAELRLIYKRQQRKGGIIDPEAERNRYFISLQAVGGGDRHAGGYRPWPWWWEEGLAQSCLTLAGAFGCPRPRRLFTATRGLQAALEALAVRLEQPAEPEEQALVMGCSPQEPGVSLAAIPPLHCQLPFFSLQLPLNQALSPHSSCQPQGLLSCPANSQVVRQTHLIPLEPLC